MKILKNLYWLLLMVVAFVSSCKKEVYTLDALPDKSQVKFEAIQDKSVDPGGNTVILINKTPGAVAIWDYTTGTSNRDRDTIKYAFRGDYVIKFSAMTAGGVVKADSVVLKVTQDNLNYVSDPLWINLSGGPGNEKTWILDIKAQFFAGPLYFYGTNMGWLAGGDKGCYGADCWNWNPDYKGNSWLMADGDYGTMTFSLKGGPFVKTNHLKIPARGTESGTYYLDKDAKTLTMNGATPLHDTNRDGCVAAWGNIKVMSLTENSMQLAVLRTSCEGPCLLVYNYVTKEYSDSYVPPPVTNTFDEGYKPRFAPGALLDYLTGASVRVWKIDAINPVDWIKAGKGWTKVANDSRSWGWNTSWDAAVANSYIKFQKSGMKYTRNQGGVETTGTFTINAATNEVVLNNNTLLLNPASWMNPTNNTLKVIKAFPGKVEEKGIWFGTSYNAGIDEWLAFHYILF